jgi:hypothetical protein
MTIPALAQGMCPPVEVELPVVTKKKKSKAPKQPRKVNKKMNDNASRKAAPPGVPHWMSGKGPGR